MRSSALNGSPAIPMTRCTIGARASAWPRSIASCSSATTCSPDSTATEQAPRAVSIARIFTDQACSEDAARFLKVQAPGPRPQADMIAVSKVAQQIGLDRRPGEEFLVNACIIESRHRSAVQTQGTGRNHKIPGLQTAVAKCRLLKVGRTALLPGFARARIGTELWHELIKFQVIADNGGRRRGHGLLDIARIQMWFQPLFGLFRNHK